MTKIILTAICLFFFITTVILIRFFIEAKNRKLSIDFMRLRNSEQEYHRRTVEVYKIKYFIHLRCSRSAAE